MSFLKIIISSLLFLFPVFLVSAGNIHLGDIFDTIISSIFAPLVAILIGLGLVSFFWGVVKYLSSSDSEEDHKKGKQLMIYGVIIVFVMVSVWGLVEMIKTSFLGSDDIAITAPEF